MVGRGRGVGNSAAAGGDVGTAGGADATSVGVFVACAVLVAGTIISAARGVLVAKSCAARIAVGLDGGEV